jgi:hypothetical protein
MAGDQQDLELKRIRMLREFAKVPWLGPNIRGAINEEISIRKANRAALRSAKDPGKRKDEQPWDKLVSVSKYNWQRRIAKTDPHVASPEERRAFYELILRIVWLEKPIRRVIAEKLGISTDEWMQWWADAAVMRICAHLRRMEDNGEEPREEDAIAEVANEDAIGVPAAKRRLERHSDRWEEHIAEWFKEYKKRRGEKAMKEWNKRERG